MVKTKLSWLDLLLGVGLAMVVGGLALAIKDGVWEEDKINVVRKNEMGADAQASVVIYIDISGAVVNPGVYELNQGDRLIDVLRASGGLSIDADRDWVGRNINRARVVKDGEKIYIPKIGEILGVSNDQISSDSNKLQILNSNYQKKLVDLNTAGVEELDKLPGVGPAIAKRIIDYREQNGGFVSIEEIKLVSGIGDKMFEKIKDLITI